VGTMAELLVSDPPRQSEDALLALSPLFSGVRTRPGPVSAAPGRLGNPVLAAIISIWPTTWTRQHALPAAPGRRACPTTVGAVGSRSQPA